MIHNHKQHAYEVMMEKCGLKLNDASKKRLNDLYTRVQKQATAKMKSKQKRRAIEVAKQTQYQDTSKKRKQAELDEDLQNGTYVPSSLSTKIFNKKD